MSDETYVPGLNNEKKRQGAAEFPESFPTYSAAPMPGVQPAAAPQAKGESETPVVGFLYSLSRNGEPEWWPLHIGQNKIGKDADMDICLAEGSITGHHANINIKRMRRTGSLSASLVDVGSKNGIVLNEEEIDYEPHTIKNEDIVIFGLNYKCVVILVEPTKYGLEPAEEFVAIETAPKAAKAEAGAKTMPIGMANPAPMDPFEGFNDNATINISGGGVDLSGGTTKIL